MTPSKFQNIASNSTLTSEFRNEHMCNENRISHPGALFWKDLEQTRKHEFGYSVSNRQYKAGVVASPPDVL
jgi:hypothetical protein